MSAPQARAHLLVAAGAAPRIELLETIRGAQLLYGQWVAVQGQPRQRRAALQDLRRDPSQPEDV